MLYIKYRVRHFTVKGCTECQEFGKTYLIEFLKSFRRNQLQLQRQYRKRLSNTRNFQTTIKSWSLKNNVPDYIMRILCLTRTTVTTTTMTTTKSTAETDNDNNLLIAKKYTNVK